jgi:uncharacterized protein YndB with AHSA1/START domain
MKRDINMKWVLSHPPEDVWNCLTDPKLVAQWLMKNDFKAEVGHSFQFHAKPRGGWNGTVYCKVLEVIPTKKLSYSWKGGPREGVITLDTIVTWTLIPTKKGTELLLSHAGFGGFGNIMTSFIMQSGWGSHIKKRFENLLNNSVNASH